MPPPANQIEKAFMWWSRPLPCAIGAMAKDDPALLEQIVKGIADACVESGCSLVGGETAILPDMYQPGDYDLAGFCVGVVERSRLIDGSAIEPGDTAIGIASSGVHSNGYSLVRKAVFEIGGLAVGDRPADLGGRSVGEGLLAPNPALRPSHQAGARRVAWR